MVLVTLSGATDPDGDAVVPAVTGVAQNESVTDHRDQTSPDTTLGPEPNQLMARAENYHGWPRVYTIGFTVTDLQGSTCSASVQVTVQRRKPAPKPATGPTGKA
jgi:hypothetical protein